MAMELAASLDNPDREHAVERVARPGGRVSSAKVAPQTVSRNIRRMEGA